MVPEDDSGPGTIGCPHIKAIATPTVDKVLKDRAKCLNECRECVSSMSPSQIKQMRSLNATQNNTWMCLKCGNIGCGGGSSPREVSNPSHAQKHFSSNQNHCMAANLQTGAIYCLKCQCQIDIPIEQLKKKDPEELSYKEGILLKCTELLSDSVAKAAASKAGSASQPIIHKPGKGSKGKLPKQSQKKREATNAALVISAGTQTVDLVKCGTEDPVSVSPGASGICGLRNLGNTCFFNSVMQNLAHAEPFVTAVLGNREVKEDSEGGDAKVMFRRICDVRMGPVTKGFASLLDAMYKHASTGTYNPSPLFNAISKKYPRYNSYRQQDAHELLMSVLDLISEEQKGDAKGVNTFVEDVFGGLAKSYVRCHSCGNVSVSDEQFVCVSVPIPVKYSGDCMGDKGRHKNRNVISDDPSVPKLGKKYTAEELFDSRPRNSHLSKKKMRQLSLQKRKAEMKSKKQHNNENKENKLNDDDKSVDDENKEENKEKIKEVNNEVNLDETKQDGCDKGKESEESEDKEEIKEDNDIKPEEFKQEECNKKKESEEYEDKKEIKEDEHTNEVKSEEKENETKEKDKSEIKENKGSENKEEIKENNNEVKSEEFKQEECIKEKENEESEDKKEDEHTNKDKSEEKQNETKEKYDDNNEIKSEDKTINPEGDDKKDKRIGYGDKKPPCGCGCTLDECLFWHTRQEELTGIDKYFCSKCTSKARESDPSAEPVFCDATKQIVFSRLPEVLIIHIKRFLQTSRGSLTKISTFVDIPPVIDMRPYCARGTVDDNPAVSTEYALFGVSEHGGGLGGGHYTATVQVPYNGKWYSCSDAHVTSCSASNANNSGAYILFYKRIH